MNESQTASWKHIVHGDGQTACDRLLGNFFERTDLVGFVKIIFICYCKKMHKVVCQCESCKLPILHVIHE